MSSGTNARVASDAFCRVTLIGSTLYVGSLGQDTDENGANSISDAGAGFVFEL